MVITSTAMARGKLIRNAQRHVACSIRNPPRTGPASVVIDVKPDYVQWLFPAHAPEKILPVSRGFPVPAMAADSLQAARDNQYDDAGGKPTPCRCRSKMTTPTRNVRLRP
jgi:hypothetical protein